MSFRPPVAEGRSSSRMALVRIDSLSGCSSCAVHGLSLALHETLHAAHEPLFPCVTPAVFVQVVARISGDVESKLAWRRRGIPMTQGDDRNEISPGLSRNLTRRKCLSGLFASSPQPIGSATAEGTMSCEALVASHSLSSIERPC